MTADALSLRLYVAGDGPNSREAIANLEAIRRDYLAVPCEVEIIDVFETPQRALEEGVLLTPMLVVERAGSREMIVGSLSEPGRVLARIGLGRGAGP
ncbi:Circadian clock protein KaiB [wastewater metagenome]|uniref:Circadian clock protein KaiB n=2 Tax=unclassified sequences TaxID=12908 RepID=A0A5B8RGG1_9ZZZZ|nr:MULTISPECIES: circadian clock KaiB family protein [Arhodomonas]MCS4504832.1 circadian clock KaiB family protein [Arhodomonas aquaeolei]QEA06584.1 circadian clock protein KaiB [uncultured organism]